MIGLKDHHEHYLLASEFHSEGAKPDGTSVKIAAIKIPDEPDRPILKLDAIAI